MSQSHPAEAGTNSAHKEPRTVFALIKIAVLAIEVVLIAFVFLGRLDLLIALSVHGGLAALLIGIIIACEARSVAADSLQKFTLQMIVAGPLGSASALVDEQLSSRIRANTLAEWYATIAPVPQQAVTLADRIRDDQVVRPRAKLPKSAKRLIDSGTMREKQALFASVVAEGGLEGVSLIENALRSRDQRVRVQAAAVSAYIRAKVRASTQAALPAPAEVSLVGDRRIQRPVPVTIAAPAA